MAHLRQDVKQVEFRLDGRITAVESRLDTQIGELRERLEPQISELLERIVHLEGLLEGLREAITRRIASERHAMKNGLKSLWDLIERRRLVSAESGSESERSTRTSEGISKELAVSRPGMDTRGRQKSRWAYFQSSGPDMAHAPGSKNIVY